MNKYILKLLQEQEVRLISSRDGLLGNNDEELELNRKLQTKYMKIKDNTYKGTRILYGDSAEKKRDIINGMIALLKYQGFQEISIPIIQHANVFAGKVGEENNNMMYNFTDRGGRELCLAPEYTAVVQQLDTFKGQKDVKLFYVQECFRGEKPQRGRYRQFTQLGVEILNPSDIAFGYLKILALGLLKDYNTSLRTDVKRGLDYYTEEVFEITCEGMESSVCGGGVYKGGMGFAIGIDRLLDL